ncbi:MAG: hypothetical protein AAB227_03420, partial [Pseudomonadota bacterium]
MKLKISSSRQEFAGFEAFFDQQIAPYLAEKETAREAAVTNVLILGAATAALAGALAFFGPFGSANFQIAVFAGMGGSALAAWLLNRARADITHGLLEKIASKLSFAYRGKLDRPFYYERFRAMKLLPNHNLEAFEDEIIGAYAGNGFTLCEAEEIVGKDISEVF